MRTTGEKATALSRREFLRTSGQASLSALALTLGGTALRPGQSLAQPGTSGVREIHLEARELTWELAPGKVIKAMAYNARLASRR